MRYRGRGRGEWGYWGRGIEKVGEGEGREEVGWYRGSRKRRGWFKGGEGIYGL